MLEEYRDDFELNLSDTLDNGVDQVRGSINPYMPSAYDSQPVHHKNHKDNRDNYFQGERADIENVLRGETESGCLKNVFMGLLSLLVIVASFVASFYIGKKVFLSDPIIKEEFSNVSVSRELGDVKSRLRNVKNNLIVAPDFVPASKEESLTTFAPTYRPVSNRNSGSSYMSSSTDSAKSYTKKKSIKKVSAEVRYRTIAGEYSKKSYADDVAKNLRIDGFATYVYAKGSIYRVQIGAFKTKNQATSVKNKAVQLGYSAFVTIN